MLKYDNTKATESTEKRLYEHIIAVSNRHLCSCPLSEQIERVCQLHPKAVILREKDLSEEEYTLLARQILNICEKYHVPCILHTHIESAERLGCTSIHLPIALLRKYASSDNFHQPERRIAGYPNEYPKPDGTHFGNFSVIGTSVHSVEEAVEAEALGATYLTAGHIYATDCKKGLAPRGTGFLRQVCQNVSIPVYAIGGIKVDEKQIADIRECGAKGGCIMSGMMTL